MSYKFGMKNIPGLLCNGHRLNSENRNDFTIAEERQLVQRVNQTDRCDCNEIALTMRILEVVTFSKTVLSQTA